MLIVILTISLIGCFDTKILEFQTNEDGFPIGFTRISDGVQIYLGMHIEDVERVLGDRFEYQGRTGSYFGEEIYDGQDGFILFGFDDVEMVVSILVTMKGWAAVGGFLIGDNFQRVIEYDGFERFYHRIVDDRWIVIDDAPENPSISLLFNPNNEGNIVDMSLTFQGIDISSI